MLWIYWAVQAALAIETWQQMQDRDTRLAQVTAEQNRLSRLRSRPAFKFHSSCAMIWNRPSPFKS